MLGWYRPRGNGFVVFWCQCSRNGWDSHAGSQFVVEFQFSEEPHMGCGRLRRRFGELLSDLERAQIWRMQNQVIASLPRPPLDHPLLLDVPEVAMCYHERFVPLAAPYAPNEDVWFRYHSEGDASRWAELLVRMVPDIIRRFEAVIAAS